MNNAYIINKVTLPNDMETIIWTSIINSKDT